MAKFYVKQEGTDISSFVPAVSVANVVPSSAAKDNILVSSGDGFVADSGIKIDSIDALTLGGKSAESYYNLGLSTQLIESDVTSLKEIKTAGVYRSANTIQSYDDCPKTINKSSTNNFILVVREIASGRYYHELFIQDPNSSMFARYSDSGVFGEFNHIAYTDNISNPNLLINGDFRVNQRNGSVVPNGITAYTDSDLSTGGSIITGAYNTKYYSDTVNSFVDTNGNTWYVNASDCLKGYGSIGYTVDMWKLSNAYGKLIVNNNYITLSCTNSSSPVLLHQYLEDANVLYGKQLTLSVKLKDQDVLSNSFIAPSDYVTTAKIYGGIYVGETGVNVGVRFETNGSVRIVVYARPNESLDIEYVKLEFSAAATPYTPRPYGEELALCQRYYLSKASYMIPARTNGGQLSGSLKLPCNMRIKPTLVSYELISVKGNGKDITTSATSVGVSYLTGHDLGVYVAGGGDINTSNVVYIVSVTLELSAEL